MSAETMEWLNTMTRIGFTSKRGNAWHYRQGATNHYEDAVPLTVVEELFDFDIVSEPIYLCIDGEYHQINDRQAMVTDDDHTVVGIFKSGYQGHGYKKWLLDGPADIVEQSKGEMGIGSAGLLRNRGVAWVQIEMPDNITTPEGVTFRPHLLATTSFDGTVATTYGRTVTVVVCDNTLDCGRAEKDQQIKIRHTKNSTLKLNDAREALGVVWQMADDFAAEVAALTSKKVSDKAFDAILDKLVPMPEDADKKASATLAEKRRDEIVRLYRADERAASWTGTAWGVLQAFNTYALHGTRVNGGVPRVIRNQERVIQGVIGKHDAEVLEAIYALS